jgi:hypothetical protein
MGQAGFLPQEHRGASLLHLSCNPFLGHFIPSALGSLERGFLKFELISAFARRRRGMWVEGLLWMATELFSHMTLKNLGSLTPHKNLAKPVNFLGRMIAQLKGKKGWHKLSQNC